MQKIRIVIRNGRTRSVEIKEKPKRITVKSIHTMLRSMPKELLAKALNIPPEKEDEPSDV